MAFTNEKKFWFSCLFLYTLISSGYAFEIISASDNIKNIFQYKVHATCSPISGQAALSDNYVNRREIEKDSAGTDFKENTQNEKTVLDTLKVILKRVKDKVALEENEKGRKSIQNSYSGNGHKKSKSKRLILPTPNFEEVLDKGDAESDLKLEHESGMDKDSNELLNKNDVYKTSDSQFLFDEKNVVRNFILGKDKKIANDVRLSQQSLRTSEKGNFLENQDIDQDIKVESTEIEESRCSDLKQSKTAAGQKEEPPRTLGDAANGMSFVDNSDANRSLLLDPTTQSGNKSSIEDQPSPDEPHLKLEKQLQADVTVYQAEIYDLPVGEDDFSDDQVKVIESAEVSDNATDSKSPLQSTSSVQESNEQFYKKSEDVTETDEVTKQEEAVETPVLEVDVNASIVLPTQVLDDTLKEEKDQLETYSQFAERVTAEKKNGVGGSNGLAGNGQTKGSKVKSKNYASTDCGAKFLAANPESSHSHKIINSNKDEYMLNKCAGKIWAMVELCESIRPQKFDVANFELFSNSPKDIFLFGSHRYPTREWTPLGAYIAEEGSREVQSFAVETQEFFKYIKLQVNSYYGTEFFCPLSLFRIYGLSEFEVIEETEDNEDDQIEEEAIVEPADESVEEKRGMIPDVIKNIMSGMLEVIKRGSRTGNLTTEPTSYTHSCRSLQSNFSVKNEVCSFSESLNYILACYYVEYLKLMVSPFLATVVQNADFCQELASIICTSPQNNDSYVYDSVCNNSYACVMLSPKHVLAMCHMHDPSILSGSLGCGANESHPPENVPTTDVINTTLDIENIGEKTKGTAPIVLDTTSEVKRDTVPDVEVSAGSLKNTEESQTVQLPHTDSTFKDSKDHSKSIKEPTNQSEASNATLRKPEKPSSVNLEKKDVKSDKTSGEKAHLENDSSSQSISSSPVPTTPGPSSEGRSATHTNKESIVVRLSNKIKVLEHNMSISSQYLEELSRRYKRQMEDMQRQFNITILALNSTTVMAYERDLYHQKRLESLEGQLEQLSRLVSVLVEEKENFLTTVIEQHLTLLFIEVVVMSILFAVCLRRHRNELMQLTVAVDSSTAVIPSGKIQNAKVSSGFQEVDNQGRETPSVSRRRSVDSIHMEAEAKTRERRLSGQVFMKGSYKDLLIMDDTSKEKKKKKRKLKRSISNASITDKVRSSSTLSKRDKKLEKLKRSSAGVLFSGENASNKSQFIRNAPRVDDGGAVNCHRVEDLANEGWHLVSRSRSKHKNEAPTSYSAEFPEVFASDLKRGKIILKDEFLHNIYEHQYYSDVPLDHGYNIYDRDYLDIECKNRYFEYPEMTVEPICDSLTDVYTQDFDYVTPVINDYYNSVEQDNLTTKKSNPKHLQEQRIHSPYLNMDSIPKSLTNNSALSEFRSPGSTTFKGKTKLRSDNWEWYSSQERRLPVSLSTADVVSNSSSDSSVKSKKAKSEAQETHKMDKRKRKKTKGTQD